MFAPLNEEFPIDYRSFLRLCTSPEFAFQLLFGDVLQPEHSQVCNVF